MIQWCSFSLPADYCDSTFDDSWRGRLRTFFNLNKKGLPAFSQALLQSGQQYYLITVGFNVLSTAMILAPASIPPLFHVMFTIPNVAINNAMACRVYRDIKFGLISSRNTTRNAPNLSVVSGTRREPITQTTRTRQISDLDSFELRSGGPGNAFNEANYKESGVHITTSVQHFPDDPLKISLPHTTSGIGKAI